ncbi:b1c324cb-ff94-4afc-9933-582315a54e77 [Sclerotinia trifoliorum]|uniref:Structure-specific endonuclease subunit SLX4 n=1 Tax=Sclerotinia trifoliorum TaxID=28548 RepID=A0A8H2ZMY5_9HELO|nr:b1c324cb-ff94-4afc-9933-582315a54e77 [Sclerotinia trifoliorum]
MATTDVFIISSSPPRRLVSHIASSPPLPSLDEMVNEKKASNLRQGNGIAPIPTGTTTTFASASALLRKSSSGSLQGFDNARSFVTSAGQDGHGLKKSAKPKAPRKTAPKKEDGTVEKMAKASRKTVKKKDEDVPGVIVEEAVREAADITAEKKPRKPRAKKGDDAEGKSGSVAEAIVEKKPRKSRAKKVGEATEEDVKEKVPRKSRAKKTDVEAGTETVPKEKAVRKPRAKKSDLDSNLQSKMVKGRVTKSAANASNTDEVETSKADTVSKHFAPNSVVEDVVAEEGFGLVEAIKRRTNWTPPKPTNVPIDLEDSPEAQGSDTSKGFAELLGSFGLSSNETDSIEKRISSGVFNGAAATRKRKLIEMVTTNIPREPTSKTAKEKAVKKKSRTLTDLATSAYATAEDDGDLLDAPAPLLQYFAHAAPEGSRNDGFKTLPKPRSKSPIKKVQKSKKGSAEEPILLSPESAMKQVSNQDFVFGTSSQLAREDSPSLLRDLHDAMQASNELDDYDDPFVSPLTEIAERGKAVVAAKRNLWSVAARDNHGDLMDIETKDLAHTPIAKPDRIMLSQKPSSLVTPGKDEWFDIDEIEDNRPPSTQVPVREMGPIERSINLHLSESPIQPNNTSKDTSNFSPQKKGTKSLVGKSTTPKKADASKMPDYESFTTPQLTREIQKYKFKQIKSRKKMIDLLIQCYESQNRPALGVLQGNIPITTQNLLEKSKDVAKSSTQVEPIIPSPRRGRAKKVTTSNASLPKSKPKTKSKMTDTVAFLEMDSDTPLSEIRTPKRSRKGKQPLEHISDSDNPIMLSPPRRSASQIRKVSKAFELSPGDSNQDEEAQQAQLFTHIYTAITNAPPSQDPSNPSWHEKILLYDPIILEDLASWLNTGALGKVGWDEEVAPIEVKKWCESKSICCLWKENQGGRARSRY